MRTQVGIVGAGPSGLVLSHLLALEGIDTVVVEDRSRAHVEERIRAGVLEHDVAGLLDDVGLGARMRREGLVHRGIEIRFAGEGHRLDFVDLVGKTVVVYGQQEVVKDLVAARLSTGGTILFEVEGTSVHDLDTDRPVLRFRRAGRDEAIVCDVIAGCDGFHGVTRPSIPDGVLTLYDRAYPFAWLGVLARSPPPSPELVYAHHDRGFALASMRSPEMSRLYLQCAPDEDLALWPDARIWDELHARLGTTAGLALTEGEILQKSVTAMRSFVAEPMRFGRLFLAGDAAHIVPPTGAKGMNLAIADVLVLSRALAAFFRNGQTDLLDAYSETCLKRVWKAQRFSWWMTSLLHRFATDNAFDRRRRLAELDYVTASRAASQALAENYTGLALPEAGA